MKTLLIILTAGVLSAQTVYKVTPGSKDNKIILTVENESNESVLTDIKTSLLKQSSTINFRQSEQLIEIIDKQDSKEVEFTFDVNRIVDVNKTDTLQFLISGKAGSWSKNILIGYELPAVFKLEQNYPNPFNPSTTIEFSIPKEGKYLLRVYNILGQCVKTLADQKYEAGYHKTVFDGSNLTSGIYFYSLTGEGLNSVKKMILMK